MTNLIAQATQPSGGFASWSASEWTVFFTAAGGFLTVAGAALAVAIAAWRRGGAATEKASAAQVDAAEAKGATGAMQHSLNRQASRVESTNDRVAALTPAPPSSDKPGGAGD